MFHKTAYKGLCETCMHDSTCTFRRSKELAIIQCEEFQTTEPQVSRWHTAAREAAPIDPAEVARLGLCANCAHVSSCGFPDARNKVLQCEEYTLEESPQNESANRRSVPEAVAV